ncbi:MULTISPECIES: hypothetical protein [Paraburkholderia]|jgi:hypothetical protein|uniref:Lipoprotein n=1 Tax=Paraburkholderia phenazinium TaxID=60549 RepID=A0A1N6H2A4_9BURK|nr:hypothetical protein [Paraburkholderia phenazinium]SIO13941.1 hypothetical protein SAMN05444165_1124 [Paraburkholderia phenazinium]
MNLLIRVGGWLAPTLLATACSVVAPPYTPSIDNVQALKNAQTAQAHLGTFDSQAGTSNTYPVAVRANLMRSPVGDSFGPYLADAMTRELTMAGRLAPQSDIEVKATLLKNNVDAGIATGEATVSARFVVTRAGAVRYDQVKTAGAKWDSSFAAAIAVPKAVQEYPTAVQNLLGQLYADPAFIQAIQ